MSNELTDTSRFISLILRHKPETIGAALDRHGWMDVDTLIDGINRSGLHHLDRNILEMIVREDEKQRYSFNEAHTKIRANQGHSVAVDVELKECNPPEILFHGTGEKYRKSIDEQGLIPKSRLYVHLSEDAETARKVGARHGKPFIYLVLSGLMKKDGFQFYLSANGVWLTKKVPPEYLRQSVDERNT